VKSKTRCPTEGWRHCLSSRAPASKQEAPSSIPSNKKKRCLPGLWLSRGLSGTGGSASKVTHWHGWRISTGCLYDDSAFLHSSVWRSFCHGSFSQNEGSKRQNRYKSQCVSGPSFRSHSWAFHSITLVSPLE
jgi:hypothetical protein